MRTFSPSSIVSAHPVAWWLLRTAVAYALLLGFSLWLPIGLHRIIMRKRDAWHWTAGYAALAAGTLVWIATGRHPVAIVAVLGSGAFWGSLVIRDALTMWAWHWAFTQTIADQFESLNKRFNLLENAALFVIVALGMLFVARVA